jgi:uncharacterized membrane protein YjjP (DUF1212 family)
MVVVRPADVGASTDVRLSIGFFAGLIAGILWQCLNRRDVVDRFLGFAVLMTLAMLVVLLPGGGTDFRAADATKVFGVIVGVVLAEGWLRQRPL